MRVNTHIKYCVFDRSISYIQINERALAMSKENVSQQLFMRVKERLDYYRLPPNFSIETTPLISKLLAKIDAQNGQPQPSHLQNATQNQLPAALKHQLARVVRQNNQLHLELIVAKERIQSVEHGVFKMQANKNSEAKQLQDYIGMTRGRQTELTEELREVKYKYNELMDFLHEDPRSDREYIKRLMKHKKINSNLFFYKVEEVKLQPMRPASLPAQDTHGRVKQLEQKVSNREREIKRLQSVMEYDGVNMNKLIKNFQQDQTRQSLKNADSKINYLEQSYGQIKKENGNMRKKNGLKQALRSEVEKSHQLISQLKTQNYEVKRNHKEQAFSIQQKTAEHSRQLQKARAEKKESETINNEQSQAIYDLQKKVQFLQKTRQDLESDCRAFEDQLNEGVQQRAIILKRSEQDRVFLQYEMENLKKKLAELNSENEDYNSKTRELLMELQVSARQSELKGRSIVNLEKIVNELIRTSNDKTTGTIEESLKHSADWQLRHNYSELQQVVPQLQQEKATLERNLGTLELRYRELNTQYENLCSQNKALNDEIYAKISLAEGSASEVSQLRGALKKEQIEKDRILQQMEQLSSQQNIVINGMKADNNNLLHREKALGQRVKDMEIKLSEDEGAWEVTRERLADKDNKIRQLEQMLGESMEQGKSLSNRINQLDHKNHELTRQSHRLNKKYEEVKREEEQFKNTSFKNYEAVVSESLSETSKLQQEVVKRTEECHSLSSRLQEATSLLSAVSREKEMSQFDRISLARDVDILNTRLMEMQQIERALVLENESLRNLARSL